MRTLPAGLSDHLASGLTTVCRCWRLVRRDGTVLGFTDHDLEIAFEGVTFSAVDGLDASGDVTKAGFGVGGLEVSGAFASSALTAADLQAGLYDGAAVTLWLVNWADISERVVLREGTLGEVRRADGAFEAEVRGPMQALETIRGRVVTMTCDADLGDARCQVALSALAETGTVTAVDGARVTVSGVSRPDQWLAGGVCVVASGDQAGVRRVIVGHSVVGGVSVVSLREAVVGLLVGDALTLTPGCDKRWATCQEKFSNQLNFQGFPHLPGDDKAFQYAREGAA
ncbi:MAG: DUF2163 domain-containing protein [Pseudomonadota bacterium]